MKKVYVIGAGIGISAIEHARKVLELSEDVDIVCVKSYGELPIEAKISSDPSVVQHIHKLTALPPIPELRFFDDSKRKSHVRPYKFHR